MSLLSRWWASRHSGPAAEPASGKPGWLVAGLGNPGAKYELTPHNLGFLAVDRLAERNGIRVTRPESQALVGLGSFQAEPVALAKPQTFMNRSGGSVKALLKRYALDPSRLVVIYDELALPWMHLRVRPKGSSAGHRGVGSLIDSLGSDGFARVRLGVDPGHPVADGAKFVLAGFRRAQLKQLDELLDQAAEAVESIIAEGVEKAMAKFNRRA
ncbi:MAG: aminoacyl-tRNA hydrolase [bacterium]|nr:aminoacyl-tRNA hydrolase [bacterium]